MCAWTTKKKLAIALWQMLLSLHAYHKQPKSKKKKHVLFNTKIHNYPQNVFQLFIFILILLLCELNWLHLSGLSVCDTYALTIRMCINGLVLTPQNAFVLAIRTTTKKCICILHFAFAILYSAIIEEDLASYRLTLERTNSERNIMLQSLEHK